jgi:hypothetical protein
MITSIGNVLVEPEPAATNGAEALPGPTVEEIVSAPPIPIERNQAPAYWDPNDFAEKQVQGLIQQVFFPGWPRASHQVAFSAVDQFADCAGVCSRVVCSMAKELPGTVCAIEANPLHPLLEEELEALASAPEFRIHQVTASHEGTTPVMSNLWLLGAESFRGGRTAPLPAVWLRSRLSELRREFDYTVIHAPPAGYFGETVVLGQLSDGLILVLGANKTRRVVARRTKERLQAANVRLLGIVLDQRTFPIPDVMYRNL